MLMYSPIAMETCQGQFLLLMRIKDGSPASAFKGTTLFGWELAKLQKVNTERANTLTVFLTEAAPSTSYSLYYRLQNLDIELYD